MIQQSYSHTYNIQESEMIGYSRAFYMKKISQNFLIEKAD